MNVFQRNRTNYFLFVIGFLLTGCFYNSPGNKVPTSISAYTTSNEISNQEINCITQDSDGFLWIGTARGLNRYDGYEYHQYFHSETDSNSLSNNTIQSIIKDNENKLWIGTSNGISRYDSKYEKFENIPIQSDLNNVSQLLISSTGDIYANLRNAVCKYDRTENRFIPLINFDKNHSQNLFFIDQGDDLWLISMKSVTCYDKNKEKTIKTFKYTATPNIFYANLLNNGELWVTTSGPKGKTNIQIFNTLNNNEIDIPWEILAHPVLSKALITKVFDYTENQILIYTHKNGLFLFDKSKDLIQSQKDPSFPFITPDCQITSFYKDHQENLWIGSHEQGIHPIYRYKNHFNNNPTLKLLTSGKSIKTILLDKQNRLWFSTYTDELFIFDLDKQKVTERIDLTRFFTEDPYFQDKINDIIVNDKDIWLLTNAKIIRCSFEKDHLIKRDVHNTYKHISQFTEDDQKNIWISSYDENLRILNTTNDSLAELTIYPEGNIYKSNILALSDGRIIVATPHKPIKIIDPLTRKINNLTTNQSINLKTFEPSILYEDSRKNIWIGQLNAPLLKYNPNNESIEKVDIYNVASLIEDENKDLWIGTLYGLIHYNPISEKIFTYYAFDGIGGNQFNIDCCTKLNNNSLAFGGTHGLTIFEPSEISIKRKIPLHIETLNINNKYAYKIPNDEGKTNNISQIKLKHNENAVSFYYSALDYSEFSRLRYYYQLDGYDLDWIEAKNSRVAHFANLKPGKYTFKVKITSNDNSSTESERSLQIKIASPPWFSWVAIVIYAVLTTYLVWLFLNLYSKMRINKAQAVMAIREREHEEYINKMNMSFFSNISHEFRTPLSIIKAPLNLLSKSPNLAPEEKSMFNLVQRSVQRMLRLVNQLMDLSKIEADALQLKVTRADLTYQVRNTLEIFELPAKEKHIKLKYSGLEESFFIFVDIDKLEKILSNLLSNALKFTPENGEISVSVNIVTAETALSQFSNLNPKYDNYYSLIEITDTGIGIPEDKLESVFTRYYQIDDQKNASINWGTGIGLYYTRRLLNLHHGEIKASNNTKEGSTFSFVIPANKNAYSASELSEPADTRKIDKTADIKRLENYERTEDQVSKNKETILVVDDDVDIAYFLKNLLITDFNVYTKYDGTSALESLDKISPSLIISDVLMPGMTGYDLCSHIKADINLCHIPVILLTAKTLLEEQVKGLEVGANAYVTKPFEPEYILALVKSQLKNKKLLTQILTSRTNTNTVEEDILSPKDKEFMSQLYELIEKELANPEINISVIARKMAMSRTKFYNKIKALAGETPNDFFKHYKLNRAAELLLKRGYNINEVAEMTGFSSRSHFSVSFKKQFNCNPSEYKG